MAKNPNDQTQPQMTGYALRRRPDSTMTWRISDSPLAEGDFSDDPNSYSPTSPFPRGTPSHTPTPTASPSPVVPQPTEPAQQPSEKAQPTPPPVPKKTTLLTLLTRSQPMLTLARVDDEKPGPSGTTKPTTAPPTDGSTKPVPQDPEKSPPTADSEDSDDSYAPAAAPYRPPRAQPPTLPENPRPQPPTLPENPRPQPSTLRENPRPQPPAPMANPPPSQRPALTPQMPNRPGPRLITGEQLADMNTQQFRQYLDMHQDELSRNPYWLDGIRIARCKAMRNRNARRHTYSQQQHRRRQAQEISELQFQVTVLQHQLEEARQQRSERELRLQQQLVAAQQQHSDRERLLQQELVAMHSRLGYKTQLIEDLLYQQLASAQPQFYHQ